MTYRELILKLLQNREEIICLEDHIMEDFNEKKAPKDSFSNWCNSNKIVYNKIQESGPAKIRLKKAEVALKS
jgi:hypothetical protein